MWFCFFFCTFTQSVFVSSPLMPLHSYKILARCALGFEQLRGFLYFSHSHLLKKHRGIQTDTRLSVVAAHPEFISGSGRRRQRCFSHSDITHAHRHPDLISHFSPRSFLKTMTRIIVFLSPSPRTLLQERSGAAPLFFFASLSNPFCVSSKAPSCTRASPVISRWWLTEKEI